MRREVSAKMVKGIWQNLRGLFGEERVSREPDAPETPTAALPPLEDPDYELLFDQLMEGLRLGWDKTRVDEFLAALDWRGDYHLWGDWLRRFGDRLLAQENPNPEWGVRLVQLGRFGCGEFSEVALNVGSKLVERQMAARQQPTAPPPPTDPATWFAQGNQHLNAGKFIDAIAAYRQAVKLKPDYVEGWSNLGAVLFYTQQYDEALKAFDAALEINSSNASLWFNRGFTLSLLQRPEEAIASYEKAIQLQPDLVVAWQNRGVDLSKLQQHQEAIRCFEQAIQLKPDFTEAWNSRGNALLQLERYEDAIASFDRAVELQSDRTEAWFNRGLALAALHQIDEAIASFDKVISFQPNNFEAWIDRGLTFMSADRCSEAIASFDRALEINPDDPLAKAYREQALEKLDSQSG